jgi:hypothetical protein
MTGPSLGELRAASANLMAANFASDIFMPAVKAAAHRIQRAVMRDRTAELTGEPTPGLWGRLVAAVLRRVVRQLRRDRHATVATRIRALELELGMREPDATERACQALAEALGAPRAKTAPLADAASVLGGMVGYWTGDAAELAEAARLHMLANQDPRHFNLDLVMDGTPEQAAVELIRAGFDPAQALEVTRGWTVPKLPPFTPDPRLTARTSE